MALEQKQGNLIYTNTNIAGRARDWRSISLEIAGDTIELTGVTSISYGEKQDTKLNYGIGVMPVSKGFGNISCTGEIVMSLYQMEAILDKVAFGENLKRPQNLAPFNLVVIWDSEDGIVKQDTLYQCTLDNYEKNTQQNNMDTEVTVNLNPVGIEWDRPV